MDVSLPSDKKEQEETMASEEIDEETTKQAKQAPKGFTPMYIELIEWIGSDIITLLLKDEWKQVRSTMTVGRSTLKELNNDLNNIFKEEASK